MLFFEIVLFLISAVFTCIWMAKWYKALAKMPPLKRNKSAKSLLGSMPVICLVMYVYTLVELASFDVVHSFFYVLFYILIGFMWIHFTLHIIYKRFDLSWRHDAINNSNLAAQFAIVGTIIGAALIYSGANVGDGPGFWCVFFAGGIGIAVWYFMILALAKMTGIIEKVTIQRDTSAGIRLCAYLISMGIILARASAGDWTSFYATILEFEAGWPVVPLVFAILLIEKLAQKRRERTTLSSSDGVVGSTIIGFALVISAIFCVKLVLPPLVENPMYDKLLSLI